MANFVVDSFTDTDATNLTSHTGETGATWAKNTNTNAVASPVITTNRVHGAQAVDQLVYASGTPGSADYSVTADMNLSAGSFGTDTGVMGRMSTSAFTGYAVVRQAGQWRLVRMSAGSGLTIGSLVTMTNVTSVTYRITLTMTGTAISGFVQRLSDNWYLTSAGGWQPASTAFTSGTNSDISTAGKAGLWIFGNDSGASGAQWDNFQAGDFPTTAGTLIAINDANLFLSPYNWYTSGTTYAQSANPGAYLRTKVSGTTIKLNVDVSPVTASVAGVAAHYPQIIYSIDGAAFTTYQLAAADTALTLGTGLADAVHTLEVHLQGAWSAAPLDRWTSPSSILRIFGLTLDTGKATSAPTLRSKRMLIYGDSITEGAAMLDALGLVTSADATQTYAQLLAKVYDAEVGIIGFSGQDYDVAGTINVPALSGSWDLYFAGQSRLSGGLFSPVPDYLITNHGTNGVTVPATVASLLTSWRAAAGAACKILVTQPVGYSATPVANVLSGFNTYQAATPDSNAKLLDHGSNLVINNQTSFDTTHPNVRGHAFYGAILAAKADAALTTGRFVRFGMTGGM